MDFIDIVKSRRTIRLFKQDAISEDLLLELVDAGRLAPSASNIQPLEYIVYRRISGCVGLPR
jgi:nitroreductase